VTRMAGALVVALLGAQADPLESIRKELGGSWTCEKIDRGVIIASDAGADHLDHLKANILRATAALRAHAFDPAPAETIVVCSFKDTEGFKAYTGKRFANSFELPAFFDTVHRRFLVHAEIAESFAPASVLTFLLGEHLGTPLPPPWAAAAIGAIDEKPEDAQSIFDAPAALLQGSLRRGTVPPLSDLMGMNPADFRMPGRSGLHSTLSRKLALYLKSEGRLSKFFAEYRTSYRRDPTGIPALEAALGKKIDAIEKDFLAHLRGLPWVRPERFREHARKGFTGPILFKTDDELFLAVAADVDEEAVARALGEVRKLHAPLLKLLDLQPTGLPISVRLFKDEGSFQNFVHTESPDRGWYSGYYSPTTRSISVNLAAGTSCFTHEFCHSLFEDDLGVLPPWAGEGLAALYEDFRLEKDVPVGERRQTVKTVRDALEQGRVPALGDFVQMKAQAFWGERERMRLHYEVARAVFLYLQEKGKLLGFYRALKATRTANRKAPAVPMCREALEKELGLKMAAIDEDFRRWVVASPKDR
jgi:hypothetical protein